MSQITFGTSGWRGILCDDFTFENVRSVIQAVADHVSAASEQHKGMVIGYDSRFMGKRFAEIAAEVFAGSGIKSYLCERDTPTPVISFEILRRKTAGAINFTASHNPPEYNGIKFSPSWGGPALPKSTSDIEQRANNMLGKSSYKRLVLEQALKNNLIEYINPRQTYLDAIEKIIDFDAVARITKIAVNPLYGTGRGYLDAALDKHKIAYKMINSQLDPYFGGHAPEPSESHIPDFIKLVKSDSDTKLGIATDGDADRFGILDADGSYIEPNYIIALLLDYLIRVRKFEGGVARSVATSHLIDAVAKKHGVPVYETPVGFKYIGELISQDKIVIGGEESAGLSVRGHIPEKDGILACFLVAEMVGREGKTIRQLLENLYSQVGCYLTKRDNLKLSAELAAAYSNKLNSIPSEIAGSKVSEVVALDGTKLILSDGSWVLFRKSGTEPVVRLYGEAPNPKRLEEIMTAGRKFIME